MKKVRLLFATLYGLILGFCVTAQHAEFPTTPISTLLDVFINHPDSIPVVRLDTDWAELIQHKMEEQYQDGKMSFRNIDGSEIQLDIKLRARGNVRKEVCLYPPIKIKLQKKQLKQLGLTDSLNHLKLILSCRDGQQQIDYLLKEALAYQLQQMVSPIYFRTRLIKMEGYDGEKNKFGFYAMLIEDDDEFVARLKARETTSETVKIHMLDRESYLKMVFFQYMIANADWDIYNKHNVKLYYVPGYRKIVPIAYDFDYSGFVAANYAVPHAALPITTVTQRYFMGQFVTEEEAVSSAVFFRSKKEDILKACANFTLLGKKERQAIEKFLCHFFEIITSEKKIRREFVNKK